ncbi:MAG: MFS transporter, partial [Acinetobacter sp.]
MSTLQKKPGKSKKYLALILMIIALCTIYVIPYLRYTYFTPLQQAMGLENNATKFGNLISIYGIMNVICYLPGGIIADKFDAKKLLVFSMIATGALGIWMGTWPSYQILMLIHVLLGITTVLTFWSSSVKCVNMLAAADEQGQMFGFL